MSARDRLYADVEAQVRAKLDPVLGADAIDRALTAFPEHGTPRRLLGSDPASLAAAASGDDDRGGVPAAGVGDHAGPAAAAPTGPSGPVRLWYLVWVAYGLGEDGQWKVTVETKDHLDIYESGWLDFDPEQLIAAIHMGDEDYTIVPAGAPNPDWWTLPDLEPQPPTTAWRCLEHFRHSDGRPFFGAWWAVEYDDLEGLARWVRANPRYVELYPQLGVIADAYP